MGILIGSYNKNIYEVKIDKENDKIVSSKPVIEAIKPSYLVDYNTLSYLHSKDNLQYVKIDDKDILLTEGAAHLSYDSKNNNFYTSHYHDGLLKVIGRKNGYWEVSQSIKFSDHSHIHFAKYIESIDLVGVCDLGDDKVFLYENIDGNLKLKTFYKFEDGVGPRHFIENKELNIIYVINELKPSVSILKYENEELVLLDHIELIEGAGSAIRITKDNKFLYAAVRFTNYIFGFKIKENGLLDIIQKVHTKGDHPRDFNLVLNDNYLLVANMKSNNLTLFKVVNGRLYLTHENYEFDAGASVICIK